MEKLLAMRNKMKRFVTLFLVLIALFTFPFTALANDEMDLSDNTERSIEYFEDGSYIVTEFETSIISAFSTSTVSKTKYSNYYNSNNIKEWAVKLTATFNYTGSSATCTNATTSYTIYNGNWKVTTATSSKSGRKATGNFTIKKYSLGIPVKTINRTLTISCSNTGVCS